MVKNIVAIVPARGGSKRIPKKNIIEIGGKPMIYWTIKAALECDYVSNVVVSTDDQEIADVARECGAEVPFLRDRNADDQSPISSATARTLEQMEELGLERPEIVLQLMANCPLRDSQDISNALEHFITNEPEFQISAFKYGWMNPWWAHTLDINGVPTPLFSDQLSKRSQDLPELFCPTGAIWIANVEPFLRHRTFYGPGHVFYPLPVKNALDIDDYDDLKMAEYYIKERL